MTEVVAFCWKTKHSSAASVWMLNLRVKSVRKGNFKNNSASKNIIQEKITFLKPMSVTLSIACLHSTYSLDPTSWEISSYLVLLFKVTDSISSKVTSSKAGISC